VNDLLQREVGWLITKQHVELEGIPTRVGWGQLRTHARETDSSFDRIVARTIFMDTSLTEHMIPEEAKVRWRSFEDDGYPAYDGIVNVTWMFTEHDEGDLGYNIDRFNAEDVGATHVYYHVYDIIQCAAKYKQKDWARFAITHKFKRFAGDLGRWIEIYG
jgi:hypothetical protein